MDLYQCFLKWAWFLPLIGHVSTLTEIPGALGGSGYLYVDVPVPENHDIEWSIGSWIARLVVGSSPIYSGTCSGRCQLFYNGTLRMDRVTYSDTGTYQLAFKQPATETIHRIQFQVYSILTAPWVSLSVATRPVSGSSINLFCNVGFQSVSSYFFYKDQQLLSCHLPHMSCSEYNYLLYFSPITELDTGYYTCEIRNPVSSNRSAAIHINVAVNVSRVTLSNNASSPVLAEKESVALTCSSLGTDLSYYWRLDGAALPQNSRYHLSNNNSRLVISPVTRNDQGVFICDVSNYLNNGTSNNLSLSWSPEGQLQCGVEHLGRSLELSCSWPGGYPAADIEMLFDGWPLTGKNRVTQIMPLDLIALGTELSCTGGHWGPNQTCSLIIDTPQSEEFIDDSVVEGSEGSGIIVTVTLTNEETQLWQETFPEVNILPARFSWYRLTPEPLQLFHGGNISIISSENVSLLAVFPMTKELVGNYVCSATNLMGTTNFTFALDVAEEKGSCSSSGLSPGIIAGIVIGSVAALALIVIAVLLALYKPWKHNKEDRNDSIRPQRQYANSGNNQNARITEDNRYQPPNLINLSPVNKPVPDLPTDPKPMEIDNTYEALSELVYANMDV